MVKKVLDDISSNSDSESSEHVVSYASKLCDDNKQKHIDLDAQNNGTKYVAESTDHSPNAIIIGSFTQFNGPVSLNPRGTKAELKNWKAYENIINNVFIVGYFILLLVVLYCVITFVILPKTTSGLPSAKYSEEDELNVTIGEHQYIFGRKVWEGLPQSVLLEKLPHPIRQVVIRETGGSFYSTQKACTSMIKSLQGVQMFIEKQPDIYYNFLVCGDGNVYVGRGWDYYNDSEGKNIVIAFVGSFVKYNLTNDMIAAAKKLLSMGVDKGKLDVQYFLVPVSRTESSESVGENIVKVIKQWPHYCDALVLNGMVFSPNLYHTKNYWNPFTKIDFESCR